MALRKRERDSLVPRKRGRPSLFTDQHVEQAFRLALLGANDEEMAEFWGITVVTLNVWKKTAPGFLAALMRGKLDADANVADRLYQRAMGYSHEAVKIFNDDGKPLIVPYTEHYPPDTNAALTWLRNRQNGKWSKGDQPATVVNVNIDARTQPDTDLNREIAALLARGGVTDVEDESDGGE